jgi:hypothetical protein
VCVSLSHTQYEAELDAEQTGCCTILNPILFLSTDQTGVRRRTGSSNAPKAAGKLRAFFSSYLALSLSLADLPIRSCNHDIAFSCS